MACDNCERVDIDLIAGLEPWRQARLIGQYQEGATVNLSQPPASVSALIESGQCGKDPTIIVASLMPSAASSQFVWICADETLSHGVWVSISLVEIQQNDPVELNGFGGGHSWTGNGFSYNDSNSAAFTRLFVGETTLAVLLSAGYAVGGTKTTVIRRRSLGLGTRAINEIFAYGTRTVSLGCHDPHTKAAASEPIKVGATYTAQSDTNAAGDFSLSFEVPAAAVFRDAQNPGKLRCGVQVMAHQGAASPPATLNGFQSVTVYQSATENHSFNMASLDGSSAAGFFPRIDLAGGPFQYRPDLFKETIYSPPDSNREPCRVFNGPHWHGVRSSSSLSPFAGNGRTNVLSVRLQAINNGTPAAPQIPSYLDWFSCSTLQESKGTLGTAGDNFTLNPANDGFDYAPVWNAIAGRTFTLQPFSGGDQLMPDQYWQATAAGTQSLKYETRPGFDTSGFPPDTFDYLIRDATFSVEHFVHVGAVIYDGQLQGDESVQFPPDATAESIGMSFDDFDWWSARTIATNTPGWKRRKRNGVWVTAYFFVGLKATITSVNLSSGSAVIHGRRVFSVGTGWLNNAESQQLEQGEAISKGGAIWSLG